MKKTKIVCTIGPASGSREVLRNMMLFGMNVARLNFSHGDHEGHKKNIDLIKSVREELGIDVAIILDTRGPEIRTGKFEKPEVYLQQGQKFTLTTDQSVMGNEKTCSITYKALPRDVKSGTHILIDDGLVEMVVESTNNTEIYCIVQNAGVLKSNKGINVPGVRTKLPAITDKDYEDLLFGIENEVDFVAASFIRRASDVHEIRGVLNANGGKSIRIISKIENMEGVENIDEIVDASYGIMVARGDLGVEVPQETVPLIQKKVIKHCNLKGKVVITATQMLDSMIRNPRPTRAEVGDIANAVLDGTDAVMLSGETAAGKYPAEAVKVMSNIAIATEQSLDYAGLLKKYGTIKDNTITNAIAHSTCACANGLRATAILTPTTSGHTAISVAKFRPEAPIIACVYNRHVARRLALVRGVYPIIIDNVKTSDEVFAAAVAGAKESGYIKEGQLVIVTAGIPVGQEGNTNMMRIHVVEK